MQQLLRGTINVLKTKTLKICLLILAPVLSGALLFLAFPDYNLWWAAWVALVPLLVVLDGRSIKYAFLLSCLCSLVFFPGIGHWLFETKGYKLLHHAIWDFYLAIYFGLFGIAFSCISRRLGIVSALFATPFLWVSLEYLRSNMGFMAFPWGLLSHSQYQTLQIIQIASLTGNCGVSFLVATVNAAFAGFVFAMANEARPARLLPSLILNPAATALSCIAAVLTIGSLIYGHITLAEPIVGNAIKVSVVQGNIEQGKKWDPKYAKFIMQTYADLTQEASKDEPALIVWPEAATPRAITRDRGLYSELRGIAERANVPLLLGSSSHEKFKVERVRRVKLQNSAFLIRPDETTRNQRYDKICLLPFGEYLPMKDVIPWSYLQIPRVVDYIPGKDFTVFQAPGFRFSVTICWESIFPELVREFVRGGAQFIVNITNEAWFGKTAAPHQFVSMNVFRAVENRVYLVRCANTGVSCFIDPYGRIVDRVKDVSGEDLFVRGVLTQTVIPMESKTIYNRYGDWLAWLSIGFSGILVIVALLRKKSGQPCMA